MSRFGGIGGPAYSSTGDRAIQLTYDTTGARATLIDTSTGTQIGDAILLKGKSSVTFNSTGTEAAITSVVYDADSDTPRTEVAILDTSTGAFIADPVSLPGASFPRGPGGSLFGPIGTTFSADDEHVFQSTNSSAGVQIAIISAETGAQLGNTLVLTGAVQDNFSSYVRQAPNGAYTYTVSSGATLPPATPTPGSRSSTPPTAASPPSTYPEPSGTGTTYQASPATDTAQRSGRAHTIPTPGSSFIPTSRWWTSAPPPPSASPLPWRAACTRRSGHWETPGSSGTPTKSHSNPGSTQPGSASSTPPLVCQSADTYTVDHFANFSDVIVSPDGKKASITTYLYDDTTDEPTSRGRPSSTSPAASGSIYTIQDVARQRPPFTSDSSRLIAVTTSGKLLRGHVDHQSNHHPYRLRCNRSRRHTGKRIGAHSGRRRRPGAVRSSTATTQPREIRPCLWSPSISKASPQSEIPSRSDPDASLGAERRRHPRPRRRHRL